MAVTAGLDVGGAHLKVAVIEDGRTIAVEQITCALWRGFERLDEALAAAAPLTSRAQRHAITMTGELSDLFPDRRTGALALIDRLEGEFGTSAAFWIGPRGFGTAAHARAHHRDVGSTNFLATAAVIARHVPDALLIDMGSTTTDIIPIIGGRAAMRGLTDATRQATGELVYTGLTRTPVMGVAQAVPFAGTPVTLARELLANMADVRRILGTLADGLDQHATADGKGRSVEESVTRLARHLGRDATEADLATWQAVAAAIEEAQVRSIHDGTLQVLSAAPMPASAPVVAAGIGAEVVERVAQRLGRPCRNFGSLITASDACRTAATHAAPAVAVALLLPPQ